MNTTAAIVCALAVVAYLCVVHSARGDALSLRIVADASGNESLVVRGRVGWHEWSFMVDTAYAGPPVVSTSYLADPSSFAAEPAARERAVERLISSGACRSFTSGCTMRLMGIGETTETRSDMLLCPTILPGDPWPADVLVTNPLAGSRHILTMDYLLHRAPCIICPKRRRLFLRARSRPQGFDWHAVENLGGSFAIDMHVDGQRMKIVVDTGASAALSLSPAAVARTTILDQTTVGVAMHAVQVGVNGERVCSDVQYATVRLGTVEMEHVQIFANTHDVEGADGYAGMGLLRAFDLWIEPGRLGTRRSGLPVRSSRAVTEGRCSGR